MTVSVGIVPKEMIDAVWPVAEPLLSPAIARSGKRMSMATVRKSLDRNTHLLWVANEDDELLSAFVTRSAQYPLKKMLVVESLGGKKLRSWVKPVHDTLVGFAKATGHDGLELYGRDGWVKALKPYGWKHAMVLCEVDFDQETPDV